MIVGGGDGPGPTPPTEGPGPQTEEPLPSPEAADLMGLGAIVSIMRQMSTAERLNALDYLTGHYGGARPNCDACTAGIPCRHTYPEQASAELAGVIGAAAARGVRFGSYTLARMILDAGYRKVVE